MKLSYLFKSITFLSLLFLFAACGTELKEEISEETEKEEILAYLESLDYITDSVTFKADLVFYESDMAWKKEHLLKRSRGEFEYEEVESPEPLDASLATDRQNSISEDILDNAVSRANVSTITYFIRSTIGSSVSISWLPAITVAAAQWNNMSNCRVNFTRVYTEGEADIIFSTDNDNTVPTGLQDLSIGAIAATTLPQAGSVPGFVVINNFWYWHWKQVAAIMHELGHTLGFHHTGADGGGEPVFLTPTEQANSVMNPKAGQISNTFQSGDIRMARLFYPNSLPQPTNFTVEREEQGEVKIIYTNPDVIGSPYYWIRITKYTPNNQILDDFFVRSETALNDGKHKLLWGGHGAGQFRFAVRGFNFKRDVFSSRTNRLLVNL